MTFAFAHPSGPSPSAGGLAEAGEAPNDVDSRGLVAKIFGQAPARQVIEERLKGGDRASSPRT